MQLYRYETHAHTSEISKCAHISAVDLVRFYKSIGFTGLCVTDHFITGNTTVPKDLPWEERVELFCEGYEKSRIEGERIGIDVFFGWEHSYKGTDFLTYGLDKKWILDHPELANIDANDYCDLVRGAGGFVAHAHPFREAHYISMIRLLPRKVDAVEVINACRTDFENKLADQYADNYGLLKIAGSDNHIGQLTRLTGIQTTRKLDDIKDMIDVIVNKEMEMFELKYE